MDSLCKIIYKNGLNKRSVISLISVGAFNGPNNNISRQKMLYEFDSWKLLSAREQKFISENYDPKKELYECLEIAIKSDQLKINSRRMPTVEDIKS